MTLRHWILIWKVVLIGGISVFAILAVVVIIGGMFDIRRLFRTLRAQHAQRQDASNSAAGERH